jgi:hypothetical protein
MQVSKPTTFTGNRPFFDSVVFVGLKWGSSPRFDRVLRGAVAAVLESVVLAPILFCDNDNPPPSQLPTKLSRPKLQPAVANAALLTRRDVNAHCSL